MALAALALVAIVRLAVILVRRPPRVADVVIDHSGDQTVVDERGAVRSVQAADLTMPASELERIWNLRDLERLARTYWRFLSRVTLGLIHVSYTERERYVVFLTRPFVLLSFHPPEYEMDAERAVVQWRIAKGLLVSRKGRHGDGYLQIELLRRPGEHEGEVVAHVRVEVANFYPSIASRLSLAVYKATQSRIHVLVTHSFLRSLARLDLAPSRVGRFSEEGRRRKAEGRAG